MRVRLVEINLRPKGRKVRVEREVDVEALHIGRGPDNELPLHGLTIALRQATIRTVERRVFVEATTGQTINVNGLVTTEQVLNAGDRLRIGAWEIRLLEPAPGIDVALEYEEIDRPKSELDNLKEHTQIGIEAGVLARGPLSWVGVLLVFSLYLIAPLTLDEAKSSWNTGDVSRGHAHIEGDCGSCHSGGFRGVRNADCVKCHHDVGRHAPLEITKRNKTLDAELNESECANCHLEHRGRDIDLADLGSGFCSDCHGDLAKRLPDTTARNATDFGENHPAFSLSVVTDPEKPATSVDALTKVVEKSGLKFSHLHHVGQGVSGRDGVKQYLACGACHEADSGGRYMRPIEFDKHCQDGCHRLEFDRGKTAALAPHADPIAVRISIRGLYSTRVLEGKVQDPDAPRWLRFRRPGAPPLSEVEAELSQKWVDRKVLAAEQKLYDEKSGECARCHALSPGDAPDKVSRVAPVQVQTIWVPGSTFSHAGHSAYPCTKCHPEAGVFDPDPNAAIARPGWSLNESIPYGLIDRAATIRVSEQSADILIPQIDTCRTCHMGARGTQPKKTPSPCSMCHPFHVQACGLMSDPARKLGEQYARSTQDSYQNCRSVGK